MSSPTGRNFMLVLTDDYVLGGIDSLEEKVQKIADKLDEWGIIHHDLDVGTNHYHIALKYKVPTRLPAVAKQLDQPENLVQLWRKAEGNMWGYMTHQTTQAKAQKADYLPYLNDQQKSRWSSETTKEKANFDPKRKKKNNEKIDKAIEKILTGKMTRKELLSPEHIIFYHKNMTALDKAIKLRTESLKYNPPRCRTIYIQGASGTGKTSYAKSLAEKEYGVSYAFASGANDPLQDYTGERCLIIDDWRPKDYEFNELLALLDPYYRSRTHKSRYYNKPLATEMIIITTNIALNDAVAHYTDFTKEDPKQIRRRIHKLITLYSDHKDIENYNEQYDGYEPEE